MTIPWEVRETDGSGVLAKDWERCDAEIRCVFCDILDSVLFPTEASNG